MYKAYTVNAGWVSIIARTENLLMTLEWFLQLVVTSIRATRSDMRCSIVTRVVSLFRCRLVSRQIWTLFASMRLFLMPASILP